MTSVELVNPATGNPFPSFEHNTTHVVAVPEDAEWELYVQVGEPGELRVESQGRLICTRPIDPTTRLLPLRELLSGTAEHSAHHPVGGLLAITRRLGERQRQPVTEFSVSVLQHNPRPTVAATYNFRLLPPEEYEKAYVAHLTQVERKQPDYGLNFVVDWQLAPRRCFNCETILSGSNCTNCGADQE